MKRFQAVEKIQENETRRDVFAIPQSGFSGMRPSMDTTLDKVCCLRMGLLRKKLNTQLLCVVVLFFISPVLILFDQTLYVIHP